MPDSWDVQQGKLRALNEISPERRHICYRQLSWEARATEPCWSTFWAHVKHGTPLFGVCPARFSLIILPFFSFGVKVFTLLLYIESISHILVAVMVVVVVVIGSFAFVSYRASE